MDTDIKKLAKQQYFKYFRFWFIVLIIMIVVAAALFVGQLVKGDSYVERENDDAPSERVYDDANVLSDKEEDKLRELIEETEKRIQCDIILMTIEQPVENLSDNEIAEYNYRFNDWELNMQDIADDFYDHNEFGYDESGDDGDGILLLDNWYPDQEGTHISTSGDAFAKLGTYEIDRIIDDVYKYIDNNPYKAYCAYVKKAEQLLSDRDSQRIVIYGNGSKYLLGAILIPIIVAVAFILINRKSKEGKVTTTASTYVANGKPRVNVSQDNFIRKNVTSRVIQTSSSGGTRSGGGYGGGHRSSSGRSHGGGSRRR